MKAEYRNVLNRQEQSLRVFIFEGGQFPAAWHFHPQFELTYIKSSSGLRYIGDSVHNFSPGDFVLVGANLPHSWKTFGEQTAPVKSVIAQFNKDLLGSDWLEKPEFVDINKMLSLSSRGIKFSIETANELEDKLLALPTLPPFERLIGILEVLHDLSQRGDYTLLSSAYFTPNISQDDSNRMGIIHQYVKNHLQSKITIGEVAALIGLTEVSFCRYFKKIHNKSFITFLNEFKIALVCKLLIETDKTVSEIGYECGFNSISLLHRLFAKHKDMSPLAYRGCYGMIPKR